MTVFADNVPIARAIVGYCAVASFRFREYSVTRAPSFTASVRYPSHFTSYDHPAPVGTASRRDASIGFGGWRDTRHYARSFIRRSCSEDSLQPFGWRCDPGGFRRVPRFGSTNTVSPEPDP